MIIIYAANVFVISPQTKAAFRSLVKVVTGHTRYSLSQTEMKDVTNVFSILVNVVIDTRETNQCEACVCICSVTCVLSVRVSSNQASIIEYRM